MIRELVRERRFRPIFEASNQANSLKQCIPAADYPRQQILHLVKDAISLWFVMVQMSWFNRGGSIVVVRGGSIVVVHGGSIVVVQLWWFVVVCGGSWWFVVVFL